MCSFFIDRRALSRAMQKTSSPSESVGSARAVSGTVEGPTGPWYGRPSGRFGPTTALFSPELALLKHELQHSNALPSHKTLTGAFKLIEESAGFFGDQKLREGVLRLILKELIPGTAQWQMQFGDGSGSAKPDAVWLEGDLVHMIFELKNETGLEGDPFLQSLVVYSKIASQSKVTPPCTFHSSANMPRTVPRTVKPTSRLAHHSG